MISLRFSFYALLTIQFIAGMDTAWNAASTLTGYVHGALFSQPQDFQGEVDPIALKKAELLGKHLTDSLYAQHRFRKPLWHPVTFQCHVDLFEPTHIDCFASVNYDEKTFSAKFASYHIFAMVANKSDIKNPQHLEEYQSRLHGFAHDHRYDAYIHRTFCLQELIARSPSIFENTYENVPGLHGLYRAWGDDIFGDYIAEILHQSPDLFFALYGYPTTDNGALPHSCANLFPQFKPVISTTPIDPTIIKHVTEAFEGVSFSKDPQNGFINGVNSGNMHPNWTLSEIGFPRRRTPDNFHEGVLEALKEYESLPYLRYYDMTLPSPILTRSPMALPTLSCVDSSLWKSAIRHGHYWISVISDGRSYASNSLEYLKSGPSSYMKQVRDQVFDFASKENEPITCFKMHIVSRGGYHLGSAGYYLTVCWNNIV